MNRIRAANCNQPYETICLDTERDNYMTAQEACAYGLVDPFNKVSVFYTMHVHNFLEGYCVVHPRIRDLVYKGLER